MVQMHANQRDEIKEVLAGDIAAGIGLKDVTTGDTLCAIESVITLERMEFPEPVISWRWSLEPRLIRRNGVALGKLAQEDPSFRVKPTKKPARSLFPAWASYTWISSLIVCAVSSTSRPM